MLHIDINCDMGEGTDAADLSKDIRLLDFVSSANIACGLHAGNEDLMRSIIRGCIDKNVAPGAHPSFNDRQGFGRNEMDLAPAEIYQLIQTQLLALDKIMKAEGMKMHHVKPHGALYNMAAIDHKIAKAIAESIRDYDSSLLLYGLAGSELVAAGNAAGLKVSAEAFADRRYGSDGKLCARSKAGAVIENKDDMLSQLLSIVEKGTALAVTGETVAINADTICIHSDGSHAIEFAKAIFKMLRSENILIQSIKNDRQ